MVQSAKIFIAVMLFAHGVGSIANAASFDCSKAVAESELTICDDPQLSMLDEILSEQYMALDHAKEYGSLARLQHKSWVTETREADAHSMQRQLDTLRLFSIMIDCRNRAGIAFSDCRAEADQYVQKCMALEDYTTLAMNRCSSSLIDVYDQILPFEEAQLLAMLAYDPQTQNLLNIANKKWRDFVKADCEWQWSEFREGTMRGQVYASCMIAHLEVRLLRVTSSNWPEQ